MSASFTKTPTKEGATSPQAPPGPFPSVRLKSNSIPEGVLILKELQLKRISGSRKPLLIQSPSEERGEWRLINFGGFSGLPGSLRLGSLKPKSREASMSESCPGRIFPLSSLRVPRTPGALTSLEGFTTRVPFVTSPFSASNSQFWKATSTAYSFLEVEPDVKGTFMSPLPEIDFP